MPLNANFIADFSSFLDATKQSIAATDEFEKAAGEMGPALDKSLDEATAAVSDTNEQMLGLGRAIGGALASQELRNLAGDVKTFASTYIAEYAEAEAATSRLNNALKQSGETSPAVAAAYANMATELQKVGTFSDEAITEAQTLLTVIGNVKPDNMEATLKATIDLATTMEYDLAKAANMVAKAASDDGESLGKLKGILKDTLPAGADFADVMDAINEEFGGANLAAMETTAGQLANMENAMSDINETVGKVLADNLKRLLEMFQSLPEGIQTFILAAIGIGTALAPILVSITSLVSLLGAAGVGTALAAAGAAILPFLGTLALLAAAVAAIVAVWQNWDVISEIVARVYNSVKKFLLDGLSWIFNQVTGLLGKVVAAFQWAADAIALHSIVPDMVNAIGSDFGRLQGVMVRPALSAVDDVMDGFSGMATAISSIQPGTAAGLVGAGRGSGPVSVTVNMSGMMGTDDPQTRAMVRDIVSDAVMQGMRGSRLMGTA
jgi:hypothetical protein